MPARKVQEDRSMTVRKRLLAAVATALAVGSAVGGPAVVAHADNQVQQCTMETVWQFSPPLTTQFQSGTITATYTGNCTSAQYFSDWFGQGVDQGSSGSSWTNSYPYSGSCLGANFQYGYNYSTGFYQGSGYLSAAGVAYGTAGNSNYSSALETEVTDIAPNIGTVCNEVQGIGTSSAQGEEAW